MSVYIFSNGVDLKKCSRVHDSQVNVTLCHSPIV
jgi:hypothetical protein